MIYSMSMQHAGFLVPQLVRGCPLTSHRGQCTASSIAHRALHVLAGLYFALAMPVEASFGLGAGTRQPKGSTGRRSKSVPEEARIQGSLEGFVAAALTVALPPFFYIVAYRHVILQSQHLWALLLLASAPLVLLTLLQVAMLCPS